jgi:hypothetical protein
MTFDLLLSGRGTNRGLFDPRVVRNMVAEHAAGRAQWQDQLWNLLMLEQWFQTFIDRRPGVGDGAATATRVPQTC